MVGHWKLVESKGGRPGERVSHITYTADGTMQFLHEAVVGGADTTASGIYNLAAPAADAPLGHVDQVALVGGPTRCERLRIVALTRDVLEFDTPSGRVCRYERVTDDKK